MRNTLRAATPVAVEMAGMPVEAHGYIVTPVARFRGRVGANGDERSSGTYGWMRVQPVRMDVVNRDGNKSEVRIVNMQTQLLLRLVAAAIFVALASMIVPMIIRSMRETENPLSLGTRR